MLNVYHKLTAVNRFHFVALLFLGFILRLGGLAFNGIHDLDQIIFEWGADVRELGIARAFRGIYGLFSYVLYGAAFASAEHIPRYWWVPYKLLELAVECGAFFTLHSLVNRQKRYLVLLMYWLNPWFILHGTWHGFWDGPHTLLALAAMASSQQISSAQVSWVLYGAFLGASAMFKPQGLIHFIMPLTIFLIILLIMQRQPMLLWFLTGILLVFVPSTIWFIISGGDVLAIPLNYLSAVQVMPTLCNGCINVWRPITILLQNVLGQTGPTYTLRLAPLSLLLLHAASSFVVLTLMTLFSLRLARQIPTRVCFSEHVSQRQLSPYTPSKEIAAWVLTFGSLLIPQLGTKAHINHSYAATVLLIPLATANRVVMFSWIATVIIQFYGHLSAYQIGRSSVTPDRYLGYAPTQRLIAQVNSNMASSPNDPILWLQRSVNDILRTFVPNEPVTSLLSVVQFVLVVAMLREMFIGASSLGKASGLAPAGNVSPRDRATVSRNHV